MNMISVAISAVGSGSALAKQLGVTPQAVFFWRDGKRNIPAEVCPDIERITAGVVRCEDLRPDVDWAFVRSSENGKS